MLPADSVPSGLAATVVPPTEPPPGIRGGVGDHVTGMAMVAGIVAALFARERTGRGQVVDTSLLRTGILCLGWDTSMQLRFGKLAPTQRVDGLGPRPSVNALSSARPFSRIPARP